VYLHLHNDKYDMYGGYARLHKSSITNEFFSKEFYYLKEKFNFLFILETSQNTKGGFSFPFLHFSHFNRYTLPLFVFFFYIHLFPHLLSLFRLQEKDLLGKFNSFLIFSSFLQSLFPLHVVASFLLVTSRYLVFFFFCLVSFFLSTLS
jgi:hypothetical protein